MIKRAIIRQENTALTANQTTNNVLQGTRFAPAQGDAMLSIAAIATTADVTLRLTTGSDEIIQTVQLPSVSGRGIESDKDFLFVNVPVAKNEQVQLSFQETGGAVATVSWRAVLKPRRQRAR